jgi:hypothetical protein
MEYRRYFIDRVGDKVEENDEQKKTTKVRITPLKSPCDRLLLNPTSHRKHKPTTTTPQQTHPLIPELKSGVIAASVMRRMR